MPGFKPVPLVSEVTTPPTAPKKVSFSFIIQVIV